MEVEPDKSDGSGKEQNGGGVALEVMFASSRVHAMLCLEEEVQNNTLESGRLSL